MVSIERDDEQHSYENDLEMQERRKILWAVRLQLVMWIICILLILHYAGLAPFDTWVDRFKTFADSWFSLYVIFW
jgi:hypothetical protein